MSNVKTTGFTCFLTRIVQYYEVFLVKVEIINGCKRNLHYQLTLFTASHNTSLIKYLHLNADKKRLG